MSDLAKALANLDYNELSDIAALRVKKDHRPINAADLKARGILAETGPDWTDVTRANVNAAHKAVRRAGGLDSLAIQTLFTAIEEATVAVLAKERLTEAEYELLVTPVAKICAPWLLDPSADGAPAPAREPAPAAPAVTVDEADPELAALLGALSASEDDPLGLNAPPPRTRPSLVGKR